MLQFTNTIMRFTLTICFISVCFWANGQGKIDVLHYKYHIDLNDTNDSIYGRAEIYFYCEEGQC